MLVLPEVNIPFAAGSFYFGGFRLDVTAQEPKLIQTTSITKGFETISTATKLQPFEFYEEGTFRLIRNTEIISYALGKPLVLLNLPLLLSKMMNLQVLH